ncbi:MAG: hypothetical protein IIW10_01250 [Spirochaetaceae bacterium]|nr:hypothetical protein [Spirochaetaceae bacterium]
MESFSLSDEDFNLFQKCIYEKCGITFSDLNRATLESRIWKSLQSEKVESPKDFYKKIMSDNESMGHFLDLITTNLTSFFRSSLQLDAVTKTVIPELINQKRGDKSKAIKIWSRVGGYPQFFLRDKFRRSRFPRILGTNPKQ